MKAGRDTASRNIWSIRSPLTNNETTRSLDAHPLNVGVTDLDSFNLADQKSPKAGGDHAGEFSACSSVLEKVCLRRLMLTVFVLPEGTAKRSTKKSIGDEGEET